MTTAFGEPLIKEAIPVSALHIQPSSLLDQSLPEQLLPEHQSSVPSLSDSPLPASDEVLADASSMRVGLGTQLFPSLASTLQPSDTLERQLDEVANLLAQQPRLDGGPRRPMNAFLIFARWRRMQMAQCKTNVLMPGAEGSGDVVTRKSKRKQSSRKSGPKPAEVSAALGEEWKSLSQEQQAPFHRKATQLRADFDRNNPEYKFTRGSKGCAKKRRQEAMELKALARQASRQGKTAKSSSSSRESAKAKGSPNAAVAGFMGSLASPSAQGNLLHVPGQGDHPPHSLDGSGGHTGLRESQDSDMTDLPEWQPRPQEGSPVGKSPQGFGHHRRVSESSSMTAWRPPNWPAPPANYAWQYAESDPEWGKHIHFLQGQEQGMIDRQFAQHHHGPPIVHPMPANYQLAYSGMPDAHTAHEAHLEAMHQQGRPAWSNNQVHHPGLQAGMQLPQYSNMFAPNPIVGGAMEAMHWRQEGPYEYEYPQQVGRPQLLPPFESSPRSYPATLPGSGGVGGSGAHPVGLYQPQGRAKGLWTTPTQSSQSPGSGSPSEQRANHRQSEDQTRQQQRHATQHQSRGSRDHGNAFDLRHSADFGGPHALHIHPQFAHATQGAQQQQHQQIFSPISEDLRSEQRDGIEAGQAGVTTTHGKVTSEQQQQQQQQQAVQQESSALQLPLTGPQTTTNTNGQIAQGVAEPRGTIFSSGTNNTTAEGDATPINSSYEKPTPPALPNSSFVLGRRESRTSVTLDAAMRHVSSSPTTSSLTTLPSPDADVNAAAKTEVSETLSTALPPTANNGIVANEDDADPDLQEDGDIENPQSQPNQA